MRNKKDTCFKWHLLGKIYEMSLEDIGLMYLMAQIKDDTDNLRYELVEEELLEEYIEKENEWIEKHKIKMKNDNMYKYAFSSINGQRKSSTENYYREVERRKKRMKELGEDDNLEEIQTTTTTQNSTQDNPEGTQGDKTNKDTETPTGTENGTETIVEGEKWEMKTIMIFNTKTDKEEKWDFEFPTKNEKNIPDATINDKYEYDEIVKILDAGYEDGWEKYWEEYLEDTDF